MDKEDRQQLGQCPGLSVQYRSEILSTTNNVVGKFTEERTTKKKSPAPTISGPLSSCVSYVRSPDGMTAEEHTLHVRRYIWDICSIYIDCILDPVYT